MRYYSSLRKIRLLMKLNSISNAISEYKHTMHTIVRVYLIPMNLSETCRESMMMTMMVLMIMMMMKMLRSRDRGFGMAD